MFWKNKVSLWRSDNSGDQFVGEQLFESDILDGDVTEIKAKNKEEFFVSTSNGSVFYYKHVLNQEVNWNSTNLIF